MVPLTNNIIKPEYLYINLYTNRCQTGVQPSFLLTFECKTALLTAVSRYLIWSDKTGTRQKQHIDVHRFQPYELHSKTKKAHLSMHLDNSGLALINCMSVIIKLSISGRSCAHQSGPKTGLINLFSTDHDPHYFPAASGG